MCVHTVIETLHTGNWVNQPDSDNLNPSVGKWLRAGEEAGDLTVGTTPHSLFVTSALNVSSGLHLEMLIGQGGQTTSTDSLTRKGVHLILSLVILVSFGFFGAMDS